jgi:hypothetical protein
LFHPANLGSNAWTGALKNTENVVLQAGIRASTFTPKLIKNERPLFPSAMAEGALYTKKNF